MQVSGNNKLNTANWAPTGDENHNQNDDWGSVMETKIL